MLYKASEINSTKLQFQKNYSNYLIVSVLVCILSYKSHVVCVQVQQLKPLIDDQALKQQRQQPSYELELCLNCPLIKPFIWNTCEHLSNHISTSSIIMLHVAKQKSSHTGSTNVAMSLVFFSHKIWIQLGTIGTQWNQRFAAEQKK